MALSARRDLVLHGTSSGLKTFEQDFANICTCHTTDLSDAAALRALIKHVKPDVVVHAAAISSPRVCEDNPERAMAVNAPMALVEQLPDHASLIFLSTDQVYDGEGAPYTEQSAALPVNTYGRSKLQFEQILTSRLPKRHVSLRSSLILGPPPPRRCKKAHSFLQDCAKFLSDPAGNSFFSDEMRSAVSVDDVIGVIVWAIDGGATRSPGIYNMGGPAKLSRVDIALAVAEHCGLPPERVHGKPRPPGGPVKSPLDITMDSSRLEAVSGIKMRGLAQMLPAAFPHHRATTWGAGGTPLIAALVLAACIALVMRVARSR